MSDIKQYPTFTGQGPDGGPRRYLIKSEQAKRVNFAIQLGRPLLVEGEPGCGKTTLADAIADELAPDFPTAVMPVRSHSRANDMFYRFDALARLQDAGIPTRQDKAQHSFEYISLQPLGEAIAYGQRRVVLIDEIDKGDMDFQNDLLFAIERYAFPIDEIPQAEAEAAKRRDLAPLMSYTNGFRPIIVFTSNRERPLPKPFLRRCIFLQLAFPEEHELIEIVTMSLRKRREDGRSEVASLEELSERVIHRSVDAFLEVRAKAIENNAIKAPATAELIDWVHVLHLEKVAPNDIHGNAPPYWEMLFKSAEDMNLDRSANPRHSR